MQVNGRAAGQVYVYGKVIEEGDENNRLEIADILGENQTSRKSSNL